MANGANLSSKLPIIVAGPTGVGKSAFAVDLANELGGEIIGADAYQVYRGLEILTSQPTPEMLSAVPHHLIGFLPPAEAFDAARFAAIARERISEVASLGKVPIVVGGSGLYIKALTHGLVDVPPANPTLRAKLASLSLGQLQEQLAKIDPAARIDSQNPRRVLRALEISLLTGRPASELRRAWGAKAAPGFRGLLLVRDREELHKYIADNVRRMFERGVAAEVRKIEAIGPTAAMAIGFREIQALNRGAITESECLAAVTQSTRRYAKRQLTWFRNQFTLSIIDLTGFRETHGILPLAMESLGVA
ncbi:MAG TPA: tRNA (adenosine(37)-N6)-dimethylallyltransferase MiaA [Terrimicrobiaceae bacterium]